MMPHTTRRTFLAAGIGGLGLAVLAACAPGAPTSTTSKKLALWIWPNGLSTNVLDGVNGNVSGSGIEISEIGGDFKQKLVATFIANSGLPAITGIKGEDMPFFLSQADRFTDLNDLGAEDLQADFLDWKWQQAMTADGKLVGLPIDIGPTGWYFRRDVFESAGLPNTPEALAEAAGNWENLFAMGTELKAATGALMLLSISEPFSKSMGQSTTQFVSEGGDFLGEDGAVREAWERSVEAFNLGITANVSDGSPDWAAGVTNGTLPSLLGAAWYQADLKGATDGTSGLWGVALTPGGSANIGGSFLSIPSATSAENAAGAFEVMKWILGPENQAQGYADAGLFPSTPASYELPQLTEGDPFFDGQKTIEVFGAAAQKVPISYTSPYDGPVSAPYYNELTAIEATGKDPEQAWKDAVSAAEDALEQAKRG
jgi:cellobiose transport system substrate-binding protein